MSEGYDTFFNKINSDNISSISRRQSELQEMRVIELYELVDCLVAPIFELKQDGMSITEILTYISEFMTFPLSHVHADALGVNLQKLSHYLDVLSSIDRSVFADFLIDRLNNEGLAISEKDFLPGNDISETFIYLKNPLADEAYDVFSVNFTDPRLRYATSVKDVSKAVFDGEATYGLLPLEESGGERLHLASEMIYRYDLKINGVTPVFGLDGLADMKYALVSRRFNVPAIECGDDSYLEIRVSDDTSLSEILGVAEYFGCTVYRIKSECFSVDDERENCYSLVLKKEEGDFVKILGFLTMFIKTCVFVGIYKNLE